GPDFAAGLQRFEVAVVLGELQHGATARQVHATVAGVGHEGMVAGKPEHVDGGAHAAALLVFGCIFAHHLVGPLDGAPESSEHVAPSGQVGPADVALENRIRSRVAERALDLFDGEASCHVTCRVPAHAVGDDEHPRTGSHHVRVFLTRACFAHVACGGKLYAKIEAGNDCGHDTTAYLLDSRRALSRYRNLEPARLGRPGPGAASGGRGGGAP